MRVVKGVGNGPLFLYIYTRKDVVRRDLAAAQRALGIGQSDKEQHAMPLILCTYSYAAAGPNSPKETGLKKTGMPWLWLCIHHGKPEAMESLL